MDEFLRTFLPKRTRKETTFPFRKMFLLRIHACILLGFLFCPFLFDFFLLLRPVHFSSLRPCSKRKAKRNAPTNQPTIRPNWRKKNGFFLLFRSLGGKKGRRGGFKSIYGEKPLHAARPSKPTHSTTATQTLLFRSSSPRSQSEGISKFPRGEETVFRGKTGNLLRHKGWMEVHKSLL